MTLQKKLKNFSENFFQESNENWVHFQKYLNGIQSRQGFAPVGFFGFGGVSFNHNKVPFNGKA